jgi:hypothetical protein
MSTSRVLDGSPASVVRISTSARLVDLLTGLSLRVEERKRLVVGFDLEWNVVQSSHGKLRRESDVLVGQVAVDNTVNIIQVR